MVASADTEASNATQRAMEEMRQRQSSAGLSGQLARHTRRQAVIRNGTNAAPMQHHRVRVDKGITGGEVATRVPAASRRSAHDLPGSAATQTRSCQPCAGSGQQTPACGGAGGWQVSARQEDHARLGDECGRGSRVLAGFAAQQRQLWGHERHKGAAIRRGRWAGKWRQP